jgi:hypothetical protein
MIVEYRPRPLGESAYEIFCMLAANWREIVKKGQPSHLARL